MLLHPLAWTALVGLLVAPPQLESRGGRLIVVAQNYGSLPLVLGGTPPPSAAVNWSSAFVLWRMEEASDATRVNTGSACGATQTDCDLTETASDTIVGDTTNFREGTASGQFGGTTEWLECTDATCGGTTKLEPPDSFTYGAWLRPESDTVVNIMGKYQSTTTEGFRIAQDSAVDNFLCEIVNTGGGDPNDRTDQTYTVNSWIHVVCSFDDPGDTITAYGNGIASTTPTTGVSTACCDNANNFELGTVVDSSLDFIGQIDEAFLIRVLMTGAQVARVTHCEVRGVLCACDADTPANYAPCLVDGDCRGATTPTATCDTTSNTCRGRSLAVTPSACNAAAPS